MKEKKKEIEAQVRQQRTTAKMVLCTVHARFFSLHYSALSFQFEYHLPDMG